MKYRQVQTNKSNARSAKQEAAKKLRDSNRRNTKPRWVPYADMGYQNVEIAHGLAKCYIATKEDSENFIVTIRDKDGNIAKVSDVEFAKMGGALRVLRYADASGNAVENPSEASR